LSAALDWAPRCRVTTDKAVRRYVNNDIRIMNIEREFLAADDEFLCIEPELRQQYFARHLADELTPDERAAFADHLALCRKCETDAAYFAWSARLLCAAAPVRARRTLDVTRVTTFDQQNVTDLYAARPFQERLAAAAETPRPAIFPVTLTFAPGDLMAQFKKRPLGLYFELLTIPADETAHAYELRYCPADATVSAKNFPVAVGQEVRLGAFADFIAVNTPSAIMAALRCFQLTRAEAENH